MCKCSSFVSQSFSVRFEKCVAKLHKKNLISPIKNVFLQFTEVILEFGNEKNQLVEM